MKKITSIIIAMAFALNSRAQNDQILIKFFEPNISGESLLVGYTEYVQALSVNFGVSNNVAIGSGGGTTAGKPAFSDISFVHNGGKNSPTFNLYVANGHIIPTVEIVFLRSSGGGKPSVIYRITLTNVIFTSVNTSATDDCSSCPFGVENISLFYSKIKWDDPVSGNSAQWDIGANQQP